MNKPVRTIISSAPVAIILIAALARLSFLAFANLPFESDEAIVGLMARHILYQGELPVFYYGQHYMGTLEPATAAALFAILGPTVFALRLAPTLFSLAFVWLTFTLADEIFGRSAAVAAGLYSGLAPLFLLTWSVKARGGYAETLALGAWLVLLTVRAGSAGRLTLVSSLLFGLIAGLALWTNPLSLAYTLPSLLYLSILIRPFRISSVMSGTVAFAVGGAPMFFDNLRTGGQTVRDLLGQNVGPPMTLPDYLHNAVDLVRFSLPTLLGFFQASSHEPAFDAARTQIHWLSVTGQIAGILLAVGLTMILICSLRHPRGKRAAPTILLLSVAILPMALFCISRSESLVVDEPRYLLPLFSLIPVFGAAWSQAHKWRRNIATLLLVLALVFNVSSILRFQPALAAPWIDGQPIRPDAFSINELAIPPSGLPLYADYWSAYPIAFNSAERVIPSVVDERFHLGFNRIIPYAQRVADTPRPAILVERGGTLESAVRQALSVSHAHYFVTRWSTDDLYSEINPAIRPAP